MSETTPPSPTPRSPTDLRLVLLRISPWSERARWALDHHKLAYQKIDHAPFLGERRLRKLVGPGPKRATVPVLLAGEQRLTESWDIARYADAHGHGSPLIPAEREAEIRTWNDRADAAMSASRGLVIAGMLSTPEALDEGQLPSTPSWLRPLLRPVARRGMRWFAAKYGVQLDDLAPLQAKLRAALLELRAARTTSSPYLLGSFSYADIVMATLLQGVAPVAEQYIRLGPGTRRAWTQPSLAAEFQDLLTWRDTLYTQHRR